MKLNENKKAGIIYQKALKCDYEFSVKGVTGNNYDIIDGLFKVKNKTGSLVYKDGDSKKYFPDMRTVDGYIVVVESPVMRYNTVDDLVSRCKTSVMLNWKAQPIGKPIKVIFAYPETGMYLTEQRGIVLKTLEMIKELVDEEKPEDTSIEVIYITNSPIVLSDIPKDNLTVFIEGSDEPKIQGRFTNGFAGNLYGITNSMLPEKDAGVLGNVCVEVINNWIAKDNKNPDFDVDAAIIVSYFIDDEVIKNSVGRILYNVKHFNIG